MPKREDEFYARQKEGVITCPKHGCRVSPQLGCQKCAEERIANMPKRGAGPKMEKCPSCGLASLAWYEIHERYECGNMACEMIYTEVELILTKKKKTRKGF